MENKCSVFSFVTMHFLDNPVDVLKGSFILRSMKIFSAHNKFTKFGDALFWTEQVVISGYITEGIFFPTFPTPFSSFCVSIFAVQIVAILSY